MTTTTATHTIATNLNVEGVGYVIPANWETFVDAAPDEDAADWFAFDAASTEHTHPGTFGFPVVEFTWDEDETFETFAAAVEAAGFRALDTDSAVAL